MTKGTDYRNRLIAYFGASGTSGEFLSHSERLLSYRK